jgi:cell volume regulation protein A
MALAEPYSTALLLCVVGALAGAGALFSRLSERMGVPTALLFILVGMVAGPGGLGLTNFHDFHLALRLGTVALVLILFDGGLNTSPAFVRRALGPAAVLATLGVVGTAAFVAVGAHLLGQSWHQGLLLGAIVSSTDSASVFSVLRHSGLQLRTRVAQTLELESALNDPTAVILTLALIAGVPTTGADALHLLVDAVRQLAVGLGVGLALGYVGRALLRRYPLPAGGLYPVASLALAFLSFGVSTLLSGSGLLSVYVTAILVGNASIRYRTGLLRVHDGLAWLAQVGGFVLLGVLVSPAGLLSIASPGLGVAGFLTFLARPAVVALCLLPFRFAWEETVYIGWVGLRGAVPIILATFPVLAGFPGAEEIFATVFFIVVANAIVPGATVRWLTEKLNLVSRAPPHPPVALEITSTQLLHGELLPFYVDQASAVAGATLAELPFPEAASATLIIRGQTLLAPKGNTALQAGDHVYVFCPEEDLPLVRLIFGDSERD